MRTFEPKEKPTKEDLRDRLLTVIFDGQEIIMAEADANERKQWETYLSSVMRLYAGFDETSAEAEKAIREIELKKQELEQAKELKMLELELKEKEIGLKAEENSLRAAENGLKVEELEIKKSEVATKEREAAVKEREASVKEREVSVKEKELEIEKFKADTERLKIENEMKIAKINAAVKIGVVTVIAVAAFVAFLMGVAQFNAMMSFQASGGVWRSVRTVFDVGGGNGLINLASKMI